MIPAPHPLTDGRLGGAAGPDAMVDDERRVAMPVPPGKRAASSAVALLSGPPERAVKRGCRHVSRPEGRGGGCREPIVGGAAAVPSTTAATASLSARRRQALSSGRLQLARGRSLLSGAKRDTDSATHRGVVEAHPPDRRG